MRILIVDDDDIATDILANALTRFGHNVTAARSGQEALELMRNCSYRLVVLDWEMPGMTRNRLVPAHPPPVFQRLRLRHPVDRAARNRRTSSRASTPAPTTSSANRSSRKNSKSAFTPANASCRWKAMK